MTEGYIVLATGLPCYVEMARNLAASLRVLDGARRICLVHDQPQNLKPADHTLFNDIVYLDDHPLYPGFMKKIQLHGVSPYQRTMFVDADCLLVKHDIDHYWSSTSSLPFAITGTKRQRGEWKGADIAQLIRQEGAPYLVQMNSGVFCFDDSPAAASFFAGLNDFYLRRREHLGVGLHRGRPTQTDEIYLGLWMGLNGLDSCTGQQDDNRWMISTWRAFGLSVDPVEGRSVIRKPRRSFAGVPNPLGGWDRLSPTFVHFVGLKPRATYDRLSRHFQARLEGGTASHHFPVAEPAPNPTRAAA